ncbi:hypothetical protein [Flavobacterium sp.]|uniref:hypothetical protein n=1 Tax=Flavobacterium sp. TaxID=239 RepID=UPI002602142E|nr:hypothetical protein [Flavobacterium sp.]
MMVYQNDLKRILWHEFGHFLIELLFTNQFPTYKIECLQLTLHRNCINGKCWGGGIKVKPSINLEEVPLDQDAISFQILSLFSGCIFESFFLKDNKCLLKLFDKCLCSENSCTGKKDLDFIHAITNRIPLHYKDKTELNKYLNNDFKTHYFHLISKNEQFIKELESLIISLSNKIITNLDETNLDETQDYRIVESELSSLINETTQILSIIEVDLLTLKDEIKQKMKIKK